MIEGRFDRIGTTNYNGTGCPYSLANDYDRLGNLCAKMTNGVTTGSGYAGRAGCGINDSGWGSGTTNGAASPHQVASIGARKFPCNRPVNSLHDSLLCNRPQDLRCVVTPRFQRGITLS